MIIGFATGFVVGSNKSERKIVQATRLSCKHLFNPDRPPGAPNDRPYKAARQVDRRN